MCRKCRSKEVRSRKARLASALDLEVNLHFNHSDFSMAYDFYSGYILTVTTHFNQTVIKLKRGNDSLADPGNKLYY